MKLQSNSRIHSFAHGATTSAFCFGIGATLLITANASAQGGVDAVAEPASPTNPFPTTPDVAPAQIQIDPFSQRSIRGHSALERDRWFILCDPGSQFDERVKDQPMYDHLVDELGIGFGRALGPVYGAVEWGNAVREDADRPGRADMEFLAERLAQSSEPSPRMLEDFGRLGVAMHDNHNAYPEFMGQWTTEASANDPHHSETLPQDIVAAAELAAGVIEYGFNDFDRPRFFEPINEPHWSFFREPHLADWHVATREAVQARNPDVLVGGPCGSVAYLYRNDYKNFESHAVFIDATDCSLDFYSFHAYDYFRANEAGEFRGRITSGLPLASVVDLLPNYTHNTYDRETPLVFSEHGGYVLDDSIQRLGEERFADLDGFELEMKIRELGDFLAMHTMISNVMEFFEHPHTVLKAVPFNLLESFAWDPRYYSTLYAPDQFEDASTWVPSKRIMFYQLFKDVQGDRVVLTNDDPDLQARAFRDGATLYVVLNNLSLREESAALNLGDVETGIEIRNLTVRRLSRQEDGTPGFTESEAQADMLAAPLTLAGREAVVLIIELADGAATPSHQFDELPFYGDQIAVPVAAGETVTIGVPMPETVNAEDLAYAVVRVGYSRISPVDGLLVARLNGHELQVTQEDCADRLWSQDDDLYATTKLIPIDPALLQAENAVELSFPDGGIGFIGSVVIRGGLRVSEASTVAPAAARPKQTEEAPTPAGVEIEAEAAPAPLHANIVVEPATQRFIGGISTLDRPTVINHHNSVTVTDAASRRVVIDELDIVPGREIGTFSWIAMHSEESQDRPGYFDAESMQRFAASEAYWAGEVAHRPEHFELYPDAPFVVAVDPGLFPEWSRVHEGRQYPWMMPNYPALADFFNIALTLPEVWYFPTDQLLLEVANEPNAHMGPREMTLQDIIDGHREIADPIRAVHPDIRIGGPTDCWPRFERNDFTGFDWIMKPFMDATHDKMDFWSLHLYEYVNHYDVIGKDPERRGLHRSAATLDLMDNYNLNAYGELKPLVISEYGAIVDAKTLEDPESYPRGIRYWDVITGVLDKMILMIDRPDRVISSTPYVMIYAPWEGAEPWYTLYNEPQPGEFVPTDLMNLYRLLADLDGERVATTCDERMVAVRSFVDGDNLYVWAGNLSYARSATLDLTLDLPEGTTVREGTVQALRLIDGHPALTQSGCWGNGREHFTLGPEEHLVAHFKLRDFESFTAAEHETTCYSDQTIVPITEDGAAFTLTLPELDGPATHAILNLAISQPEQELLNEVTLTFNGATFTAPGGFAEDDENWWTIRSFEIPVELLRDENAINAQFTVPEGHVSTAILTVTTRTEP